MPVTMPTCILSAFELACCLVVRSETFYAKTFFTCQSVATLLVILHPLFVTNTASYGAASKVCYDRTFVLRNVTNFDVDSQLHDPEWDMDDDAEWQLFPVHLFNSIATVMSLFGFWAWLFFSPHNSEVARALDRTCTQKNDGYTFLQQFHACPSLVPSRIFFLPVGSYFALQWLANLLVAATALGQSCMQSETAYTVLLLVNLLASFGLSIVGTNLLCHRYLVEKARVMIKMYGASALASRVSSFVSTP